MTLQRDKKELIVSFIVMELTLTKSIRIHLALHLELGETNTKKFIMNQIKCWIKVSLDLPNIII